MTVPSARPTASDAAASLGRWHAARRRSVTAATGNLALIETRWLAEGTDPDAAFADATAEAAATVTVTRLTRRNLDSDEPEHGLRFWDSASPAIAAFEQISAFDHNPEWVIDAEFTRSRRNVPSRSSTSATTAAAASSRCRATSPSAATASTTR
ncbi:hypothetical protein [Cryobacterium sp. PAMC25264]|uniref:hypothetical protein n=1 Tax=Cryobacterium sp. PAMC25264 TaxID=2861288 RepID=UPI00210585F3|nr:hypothetical protein [Cryobacterium sp. PAMC25264]